MIYHFAFCVFYLQKARLTWELEQRKSLDESHKAMVVSQEAMAEEISKKRDYLESLQPKLKTILDSTKPVQVRKRNPQFDPRAPNGIFRPSLTAIYLNLSFNRLLWFQDYLDMPLDRIREQHTMAASLPRPLYVLYVQSSAYQEACEGKVRCEIAFLPFTLVF